MGIGISPLTWDKLSVEDREKSHSLDRSLLTKYHENQYIPLLEPHMDCPGILGSGVVRNLY